MELESTDQRSASPDQNEVFFPTAVAGSHVHKFVSFYLGDTHYALPAKDVAEVTSALTPTPLPDAPAGLLGIAPHRGDILGVIEVDRSNSRLATGKNKAVVLRPTVSVEMPIAFNVDRLGELLQVSTSDICSMASPDALGAEFETSVNGHPVFILEPARILSSLHRT